MEMCRGPHERNQRLVFASNFLSSANRVFSTLAYVSEDAIPGQPALLSLGGLPIFQDSRVTTRPDLFQKRPKIDFPEVNRLFKSGM